MTVMPFATEIPHAQELFETMGSVAPTREEIGESTRWVKVNTDGAYRRSVNLATGWGSYPG